MNSTFTKTKKYVILALFLLASILSVVFMGRVTINYDISEYLDDSTETKISLGIINKEFGATGNVQVMIENIDRESASAVRDTLASIPNVLTVSFDPDSENSYKDGNALFVILADGNEYSAVGRQVVEDVKAALDSEFSGRIHYGGAIVEKAKLRAAIEGEIPFILVISVCLAIAIMLLTSKSWLEPFVLLTVSGVAILLNMGTNALLGEISYITNAVSAILQLALSIDYSIVLLHAYRAEKLTESDHSAAMGKAVKSVMKPVSASALTTVAGLLALLFMSFRIGFDIGTVLMKGIVISAITSLTLLPAVVLLLDKLMCATEKKTLVFRGRGFCKLSFRAGALVVPVAVLLIVASAFLQARNAYSFTDKNSGNETISEAFGQNSAIVIVYPHNENNIEYEKELHCNRNYHRSLHHCIFLDEERSKSNGTKE
jgi:predicted RND superfamily exporter protein